MTVLLRFRDLEERKIARSWAQLRRMVDLYGFPPGKKLGPNTTAWLERDVEEWIASRSTDRKPTPKRRQRDIGESPSR